MPTYNKVILSRNILRTNKIWNFATYKKNFEFTYSNMTEIRMTGGSLLLCEKAGDNIRQYNIKLLSTKLLFANESLLIIGDILFELSSEKIRDEILLLDFLRAELEL